MLQTVAAMEERVSIGEDRGRRMEAGLAALAAQPQAAAVQPQAAAAQEQSRQQCVPLATAAAALQAEASTLLSWKTRGAQGESQE